MGNTKIVMNATTREVKRIELTQEEEDIKIQREAQSAMLATQKAEDAAERKLKFNALKSKLGLTDEEMMLLNPKYR